MADEARQKAKGHNPTPEEPDERISLYGLDPEKVIEAALQTKPEEEPEPEVPRRERN